MENVSMTISLFLRKHAVFLRNVLTLSSGTIIVQSLTVLFTPIISRIFLPEHLGNATLFLSITSIMAPFVSLCYNQAIVLPEKDSEAVDVLSFSIVVTAVLCLVLSCVTLIVGTLLPSFSWLDSLGGWFYLIPLSTLLVAHIRGFKNWCVRKKYFRSIATSGILMVLTTLGTKIGFGVLRDASVGILILGTMGGYAAQLFLLFHAARNNGLKIFHKMTRKKMLDIGGTYQDFPCYSMPSGVLRTLNDHLPILALSYLFSPEMVGLYAMATRLLQKPVHMIAQPYYRVYLQKTAKMRSKGLSIRSAFLKTAGGLVLIGALPFLGVMFLSPSLVATLLGPKWETAGRYVAILSPALYTMFLRIPLATAFVIFRKQAVFLAIELCVFGGSVIVFVFSHIFSYEAEYTLRLFVAVSTFFNIAIVLAAFCIVAAADSARPQLKQTKT